MDSGMSSDSNLILRNPLDEYPEELLLKMFDFLDVESLKKMTLVNRRWHNIVINSFSTMKRIPLIIHGDKLTKKQLIVGNWNFHKVVFKSIDKNLNTEILYSLESIRSNIREIEFIDCCVGEEKVFQNILEYFPIVEKLSFINCSIKFSNQKSNAEVLKLENLNELVLMGSTMEILCSIEAQLKSLKVALGKFVSHNEIGEAAKEQQKIEEQHLMEFLYTQKILETLELTIRPTISGVFAKNENTVYQFKLKKLSIFNVCFEEGIFGFKDENLKDFLYTQKDSVEILELRSRFSNEVYELLLNQFENVITLDIDFHDCPKDLKGYKVNKNVTKLILNGDLYYTQYLTFLSLFPNVTDIIFRHLVKFEELSYLPNLCNAVTRLTILCFPRGNYQNLKFPALKSLHLKYLERGNDWSDFVMSNPTIETLALGCVIRILFNADEIKKVCEALPNLKHLKLVGGMKENFHLLQNIEKPIHISLA